MKILVADDHFANRLLVIEILKCLGHDSIEAANGKEVLDVLEKESDIDLVFMDLEMPVMTGFEAMRFIRDMMLHPKNEIPIIALTAHQENTYDEPAFKKGFDERLLKPYSIERIEEILQSYQ